MFFPWPGLPLTRVHMCHIVRGKYVPVAGARNTLPVASEDGTGSRKAAEMVLRRIQLNTEFPPSSRALSLQELIGERLFHTSPICLFTRRLDGTHAHSWIFHSGSRRSSGRVVKVLHSSPYPITWANGHPTAALC